MEDDLGGMAGFDWKTARYESAEQEVKRLSAELEALRKDAERYLWLRDLLSVEDVCRLVDEHAQWDWCETDPAESEKTDAAVDKAMAARRDVGAA